MNQAHCNNHIQYIYKYIYIRYKNVTYKDSHYQYRLLMNHHSHCPYPSIMLYVQLY